MVLVPCEISHCSPGRPGLMSSTRGTDVVRVCTQLKFISEGRLVNTAEKRAVVGFSDYCGKTS